MSGYDIKKLVEASVGNFWTESYGQIYPILRRLQAEGLAAPVERARGGRSRRPFAISPAGRKELDRWLAEPAHDETGRIEVLLKLFFGGRLSIDAVRRQIESYRGELEESLARYEAIESALRAAYVGNPDLPFWIMTVRYGQFVKRALLSWCDESLASAREA
jgi:DNA-binding PadR family transcriptional regulator